jgi:hypothetical protein
MTLDYVALCLDYPMIYSQVGSGEPESSLFGHTIVGLSGAHQTIQWVAPDYPVLLRPAHLLLLCAKLLWLLLA